MRGAEPVNDEFEVGYNQRFEDSWHWLEIIGRIVMIIFVAAAFLGFLGRGPYSHARATSASHLMSVDYEPISRHGTSTMITVHLNRPTEVGRTVKLLLDQNMIEPMGYSHSTPLPDYTSTSDAGVWLTFDELADQHNALVRFDVAPNMVGPVSMEVTDGTDSVKWTMLVVP